MKATIISIFPEARKWGDKFPDACSVGGLFEDGSAWEVNTKIGDPEARHRAALNAILRQEAEFDVEAKPDYQGQKQWKIKEYPGKPQSGQGAGGGGGRGNYTPRFTDTAEGHRVDMLATDRRCALMQAVAHVNNPAAPMEEITKVTTYFYFLLRSMDDAPATKPAETPHVNGDAPQASQPTTGPSGVWEGPGQCPSCHCPVGKPHGTNCKGVGTPEAPLAQ